MARDHRPPSFYHILLNPSSPHLRVPVKFVKKHLRNKILKDPIIKSENGEYLWKLKMKKFDDHSYCFVNGWSKVVKDVGLLLGEFLLFKYVGSSVFLMHVYSVNGCEKVLVPRINSFKVVDDDKVSVFDDVEDEVEDDNDVEYEVEEDEDVELGDDGEDEDEDYVDVDGHDGDPYFIITSSKRNQNKLRFPPDIVAWAEIYTKETITLKNDDGYEKEMRVRSYKQNKSTRYYVAKGWKQFQRSNDISEGDECVFKFITSEDKLCLAKVTKKRTRGRPLPPAVKALVTEVVDGMDDKDADDNDLNVDDVMDGKDVVVNDNKDEDENVEPVDDGKDMVVDENKDDDENVEPVDDGIDGKDVVVNENKDEDENVEPVDDVMDGKDVVVDDNKDDDENVEPVGDGMDSKDVVVDENKDADENVEPVGDGMDSKDVVVDENKDDDENAAPLDDVMYGKDVVVDDSKDEDENVELVDDDMDGKDVVVDDIYNKDEDENVEPVDDDMDGKDVVVDDNKDKDENDEPVDDDMDGKDVVVNENKDEDENVEPVDDGIDGKDVVVDDNTDNDENVEPVNDVMDAKDVVVDDNKDEDKDVEFVVTITPSHKSKLRLPSDFVASTGIESRKIITMKSLDGNETQMFIRTDKQRHRSTQYHLSVGWPAFRRSNNISEGDECVFMYTTSEDKMSLAKVSKKITPPTEVDDKDEDENVKLDDGMDIDTDENKDPEFVVTITPIHKSKLVLPKDFVVLAGIESKEHIIMKSLDGDETKFSIRTDKRCRSIYLSPGWPAFNRSNNLSEGDKCVFKYIRSEDRLCLAKFTKKKTETRLPSPAEVVKRKRGQLLPATENTMTAAENVKTRSSRRPAPVEITVAEAVKRKRGGLPPLSPRVTKHVKRKKGVAEGVDEGVNVAKQRRGRLAK